MSVFFSQKKNQRSKRQITCWKTRQMWVVYISRFRSAVESETWKSIIKENVFNWGMQPSILLIKVDEPFENEDRVISRHKQSLKKPNAIWNLKLQVKKGTQCYSLSASLLDTSHSQTARDKTEIRKYDYRTFSPIQCCCKKENITHTHTLW